VVAGARNHAPACGTQIDIRGPIMCQGAAVSRTCAPSRESPGALSVSIAPARSTGHFAAPGSRQPACHRCQNDLVRLKPVNYMAIHRHGRSDPALAWWFRGLLMEFLRRRTCGILRARRTTWGQAWSSSRGWMKASSGRHGSAQRIALDHDSFGIRDSGKSRTWFACSGLSTPVD
jgi:hypothetical protein